MSHLDQFEEPFKSLLNLATEESIKYHAKLLNFRDGTLPTLNLSAEEQARVTKNINEHIQVTNTLLSAIKRCWKISHEPLFGSNKIKADTESDLIQALSHLTVLFNKPGNQDNLEQITELAASMPDGDYWHFAMGCLAYSGGTALLVALMLPLSSPAAALSLSLVGAALVTYITMHEMLNHCILFSEAEVKLDLQSAITSRNAFFDTVKDDVFMVEEADTPTTQYAS